MGGGGEGKGGKKSLNSLLKGLKVLIFSTPLLTGRMFYTLTGPLDRNCSPLIIPACKNLGVSNYTLVSLKQQKRLYQFYYRKEYKEGNVETNDPPGLVTLSKKYPRCKNNIKKLYCGEYLPPCFPDEPSAEGPGFYTICQSVCDEITRDCPDFFR